MGFREGSVMSLEYSGSDGLGPGLESDVSGMAPCPFAHQED